MADRDYIATWRTPNMPVCASVVRVVTPPHEEPKGETLQGLVVEAVAVHNGIKNPDDIELFSVIELPNHTWCMGHSREVVVGGRPASLEAGHNGWRIHL